MKYISTGGSGPNSALAHDFYISFHGPRGGTAASVGLTTAQATTLRDALNKELAGDPTNPFQNRSEVQHLDDPAIQLAKDMVKAGNEFLREIGQTGGLDKLHAIRTRMDGIWDDPELERIGPLGDTLADIRRILDWSEGE